jgi:DUF1365 family protein
MLCSAIYEGVVRHRRFAPTRHEFRFPLFMMYLDLSELEAVFRPRLLWSASGPNVAWLRRADYLGDPAQSIDAAVRDRVESAVGRRPSGAIRMLTHLRYCGYCFNPVTIYYCFDEGSERVDTVVAEITNTPWKERHAYVLDGSDQTGSCGFRFDKEFHISPFMGMDQRYTWRFSQPAERLGVHMLSEERADGRVFDATLKLRRRAISGRAMAHVLARYPLMTAQVITRIHWEALRLWMKRTPVYRHPRRTGVTQSGSTP